MRCPTDHYHDTVHDDDGGWYLAAPGETRKRFWLGGFASEGDLEEYAAKADAGIEDWALDRAAGRDVNAEISARQAAWNRIRDGIAALESDPGPGGEHCYEKSHMTTLLGVGLRSARRLSASAPDCFSKRRFRGLAERIEVLFGWCDSFGL